jgi:hypothetical protein
MATRYKTSWISANPADRPKPVAGWGQTSWAGAKVGRSYNLVPLAIATGREYGWLGDDQVIDESKWPSHKNYRPGLKWSNDLTESKSYEMAKTHDMERQYEDLWKRSGGWGKTLGSASKWGTMLIADEVNLIPIGGQIYKAASVGTKIYQAAKTGAKWGAAYGVSEALLTNPARRARGQTELTYKELAVQATMASVAGAGLLAVLTGGAAGITAALMRKKKQNKSLRESMDITPEDADVLATSTKAVNEMTDIPTTSIDEMTPFATEQFTIKDIIDQGGVVHFNRNGQRTSLANEAIVSYTIDANGKVAVKVNGVRKKDMDAIRKNILADEISIEDLKAETQFKLPDRMEDYDFKRDKKGNYIFENVTFMGETFELPKRVRKKTITPRNLKRKIYLKRNIDGMHTTRKDVFEFDTTIAGAKRRARIEFDEFGNPKLLVKHSTVQGKVAKTEIFTPVEKAIPSIANPDVYAKIVFMDQIGKGSWLGKASATTDKILKKAKADVIKKKLEALENGTEYKLEKVIDETMQGLDYEGTEVEKIFNNKSLTHEQTVQAIKDSVYAMTPEQIKRAAKKIRETEKLNKINNTIKKDISIDQARKEIEILLRETEDAKRLELEGKNLEANTMWVKRQRQIRNRDVDGTFEYLKNKENIKAGQEWSKEFGPRRSGERALFFTKGGRLYRTSKKTALGQWDKSDRWTTDLTRIAEVLDMHFYSIDKNKTYKSLLNDEGEEYLKCAISEVLKLI